jgi:hypothetical protein
LRKVLPLTGIGGVRAFNVFHSVILGMSLIPVNIEKGYRLFLDELDQKDDTEKRKFFIDGLRFVPLEESDIEAVIRFVTDENGVPLSKSNTRLMSSSEIIEAMTDVFLEISRINVSIVTEGEKKN